MWQRRGASKYNIGPRADRTALGRVFDSKREMVYALEFEQLKKTGEILELEYQPTLELIPRPNRITYRPDFRIVWRNGKQEYVDVKGMETDAFKLKKKLFAYAFPKETLVILK